MQYYNSKIDYKNGETMGLLDELEKMGCPNISIPHWRDDNVVFASNSIFPTYADIIDFLMGKGYTIYIEPCSTFATANHIGWWWALKVYDINDGYDNTKYEDVDMYAHWDECALAAITKAVELLKEKES